jgi:CDP-glucose 4,6-dehydratase
MVVKSTFWHNKTVLITGHTGFKGSWLSLWLQQLGVKVIGFSLESPTQTNLFEQADVSTGMKSIIGDIRDLAQLQLVFREVQPEIVFHLAAQSLVKESYSDPVNTYTTNVIGSLNVLEAVRQTPTIRSVVMVSTDKCYDNKEWAWGYREIDPLGGHDPYSSSKGCMEIMIASYRASYFPAEDYAQHKTAIASARAGNVIGGGDWAADRLVPDILNGIKNDQPISLRYPHAIRPWQHVLEPLCGYMLLAEKLFMHGSHYAQSWNFGPDDDSAKSVKWIAEYMLKKSASTLQVVMDNKAHLHEAHYLKLDCSKTNMELNWQAKWSLSEALDKVLSWSPSDKYSARDLCLQQIAEYSASSVRNK